jgi:hypothetical protein
MRGRPPRSRKGAPAKGCSEKGPTPLPSAERDLRRFASFSRGGPGLSGLGLGSDEQEQGAPAPIGVNDAKCSGAGDPVRRAEASRPQHDKVQLESFFIGIGPIGP